MDENIVRILASYGCKYMADDNKEMIEEIEAYVKKREEQLHIPIVSQQSELLPAFLERRGDDIIILKTAGTDVSLDWQEYLKAGNCG